MWTGVSDWYVARKFPIENYPIRSGVINQFREKVKYVVLIPTSLKSGE